MLENWTEQLRRGTLEMAVLLTVSPGRRYGRQLFGTSRSSQTWCYPRVPSIPCSPDSRATAS